MTTYTSLKIVGGLLPADPLDRIFADTPQVPGTAPETYGLQRGESVRRQASRSWLYLLEVWQEFKRYIDQGSGETGAEVASARVTRERWLRILLRELDFHDITTGSFDVEDRSYPVSNRSGNVPIHLLGWATDLDHRTPHVAARAPQSMVQELLNREDAYLWAILSNGAALRLLRDSTSLVGSAYVEFDLEAIFDGGLFSDFVRLYLLCHESRFADHDGGGPASCYLEQWRNFAAQQSERALEQLRDSVKRAVSILGTGFLAHPANPQLRERLDPHNGDLKLEDFNRALLRVVYRILFWFVAEDRGALLQPDPDDADADTRARLREARDRYATYFSSIRLRQLARRHRGGRHGDLFEAAQLVFDALGAEGGVPELALPGIGGIFESKRDDGRALPLDEPLAGARLSNEAFLGAVRALSLVKSRDGGALRRVDFGNLGAEELGSVYESLLELIPQYDDEQLAYTLESIAGNERKETGSYYTPTSLVECLLDSALDPLLDEACAHGIAEERISALLDITVCDPACGSGHFLVAAARRIAKRVAAEETGEPEPPDAVVRAALRRVVGRCIYGVDLNPMAAELAKVSLWLEALEPGKPLSYLDQNIRVGNSLLGVTPALLADGLPDAAFTPIEGDDRKVASALKKQNASEREGQRDLFSLTGIEVSNAIFAKRATQIARTLPDSLEDLHIHQQRQALELARSPELRVQKLLADAWCAAFVQPKTAVTRFTAITHAVLELLTSDTETRPELVAAEKLTDDLSRQYRFFHWHIEFPHIFRVGNSSANIDTATAWAAGFSCVIGNPPWENIEFNDRDFFARNVPDAAILVRASRKQLIEDLYVTNPSLAEKYHSATRLIKAVHHFISASGVYPLYSRGMREVRGANRYKTDALFVEGCRRLVASSGLLGQIIPTGIATDAVTQFLFKDIISSRSLVSLYDFENSNPIFHGVHRSYKFSLMTLLGRLGVSSRSLFAFFLHDVADLARDEALVRLSPDEIDLLHPNTGTLPVFRTRRDAEVALAIYRRVPVLVGRNRPNGNAWGVSFMQGLFNLSDDLHLFQTRNQLVSDGWRLNHNVFEKGGVSMLPLYEGKMGSAFDHRFAEFFDVGDTDLQEVDKFSIGASSISPRYWVNQKDAEKEQSRRDFKCRTAFLAHRRVARNTDERTCIAALIPWGAVSYGWIISAGPTAPDLACLASIFNSFVYDYLLRGSLTQPSIPQTTSEQIPVLQPELLAGHRKFMIDRVLELTYTSYDMRPFSNDLQDGGEPFCWDKERRATIRAELDAACFHLYGLDRCEVEHIMDSFDTLRRREEKPQNFGEFHTKRLILERYDAMVETMRAGGPYQTILDPPPGQGPRHPARAER